MLLCQLCSTPVVDFGVGPFEVGILWVCDFAIGIPAYEDRVIRKSTKTIDGLEREGTPRDISAHDNKIGRARNDFCKNCFEGRQIAVYVEERRYTHPASDNTRSS